MSILEKLKVKPVPNKIEQIKIKIAETNDRRKKLKYKQK